MVCNDRHAKKKQNKTKQNKKKTKQKKRIKKPTDQNWRENEH